MILPVVNHVPETVLHGLFRVQKAHNTWNDGFATQWWGNLNAIVAWVYVMGDANHAKSLIGRIWKAAFGT